MVEIHRLNVFLVNLETEPAVMLFDLVQQRAADAAADSVRRDKQRTDKAGLHHADKTLDRRALFPHPGAGGRQVDIAYDGDTLVPVCFVDKGMGMNRAFQPQRE